MILDGADVYLASAVNSAIVSTHFATLAQGSVFLSSGFLGLFFGSIFAGFILTRPSAGKIPTFLMVQFKLQVHF